MTADTISAPSSGSGKYQQITIASGSVYSNSIYVKLISGTSTSLRFGSDTNATTIKVNPQTMAITSTGANVISSSSAYVGNGWTRFMWAWSVANTTTSFILYNDTSSSVSFSVWGMQTELGAFATSYIPTTSAAVTRAADFIQIPAGVWFASSQGSLFANSVSSALGAGNYRRVAEINNGTSSNRMLIGDNGGPSSTLAQIQTSAVTEAALSVGVSSGAVRKQGLAYKVNDIAYVLNNGSVVTDTSAALPAVTTLNLGSSFSAANSNSFLDGWISKFKYYPARVPDAQLQALTQ